MARHIRSKKSNTPPWLKHEFSVKKRNHDQKTKVWLKIEMFAKGGITISDKQPKN